MGCDIHAFVEVKRNGEWELMTKDVFPLSGWEREYYKKDKGSIPFNLRAYSLFGWLANVRNYSDVEPLSKPKGIPDDTSEPVKSDYESWDYDAHSASYYLLSELLDVDYSATVEDRRTRVTVGNTTFGSVTSSVGEEMSLYEFLPRQYFNELEIMKTLGEPDDVRVVFWFDN